MKKATGGRPTGRGGPGIGLGDLGEPCGMWALWLGTSSQRPPGKESALPEVLLLGECFVGSVWAAGVGKLRETSRSCRNGTLRFARAE